MGTVSVPSSTLCLNSGVANGDICFLDRKRCTLIVAFKSAVAPKSFHSRTRVWSFRHISGATLDRAVLVNRRNTPHHISTFAQSVAYAL